MATTTLSPLFTTAPSRCVSPTTSTDSYSEVSSSSSSSPQASPTMKLPTLQFAISSHHHTHRRPSDVVQLPSLAPAAQTHHQWNGLQLSMAQCETPHYLPGIPTYPETSPMDKRLAVVSQEEEEQVEVRPTIKKGTRRGTLNAEAKNVLKAWMFSPQHFAHPYPSEEEKEVLAMEAGIEVKQLSNWFTNARKRLWQPVLRQSGVEVKNFLSTGRGGPRGNKLEMPLPPSSSTSSRQEKIVECLLPEPSLLSRKRSWSGEEDKKQHKIQVLTTTASQLVGREEENASTISTTLTAFEEHEILAAASLLRLHRAHTSVC